MAEKQITRNVREINRVLKEFRVDNPRSGLTYLTFGPEGQIVTLDSLCEDLLHFKTSGELEKAVHLPRGYSIFTTGEDGNFLVYNCDTVVQMSPDGKFTKDLIKCDSSPSKALRHEGQTFVSHYDGTISVYNINGELQSMFGSKGNKPGQFNFPDNMCIGPDDYLYICDWFNHRVQVFEKDGTFVRQFGEEVLEDAAGIAVTKDGYIAVTSNDTRKISFFTVNGKCVHEVKDVGLVSPGDIIVDEEGFIYVNDYEKIVKL